MKLSLYQIDAFAEKTFEGNPAAVCPLNEWLPENVLQAIALENNLSETAFFVQEGHGFHIRWFTPLVEVDLCGHATLASAYVLFELLGYKNDNILFQSKSGELKVNRKGEFIELDFPRSELKPVKTPVDLVQALRKEPVEVWKADDYIVVYNDEADIVSMSPNFTMLSQLDCRGICITAPGKYTDFVSRFFAPRCGINEDPVTGSAHCELMPYWVDRLGKNKLSAVQLSKRSGRLQCELVGDRVLIAGKAVKYLEGIIEIDS